MANNLAAFKPEIWSDTIVDAITPMTVGLNFVNSEYEGEITESGGTVYVLTFGDVTVEDYTPGTDYTISDLTGSVKEALTMSQFKSFRFKIDDIEAAQSNVNLIAGYANKSAVKLATTLDKYILSSTGITANNITGASNAPIAITKDNVDTYMLEACKRLDTQGVSRQGRWMVVTSGFANSLAQAGIYVRGSELGDTIVASAGFTTAADNPSFLGTVRGFDVYLSQNLPLTTGDPKILYGQGQPILFAAQIPPGGLEVLRMPYQHGTQCRGLAVYGKLVPAESGKALGTIFVDETP